jgi:PHP family Zn ribbon phosphoesterase
LNQEVEIFGKKREIDCEVCKIRLKIPEEYQGLVNCISCGHQFLHSGVEEIPKPLDFSGEE